LATVQLPANNWQPRGYQRPAWEYLESGGRHAELIWHRRSGKDDIALHWAAIAAHQRVANYWHMLPKANQVRKAIWEAVNPRTGKRRIDEAFPHEVRADTRESEMFIRFKNGSTWQCLGSDNFQGAIGSSPAGIVYSEWAQSNPSARGHLRPILLENDGWQLFITTPRGKNHAYRTFRAAKKLDGSFAEKLTVDDTSVFKPEQLKGERQEYIDTYGDDMGEALFEQEYYCSFEAAILGAYYGAELAKVDKEGRLKTIERDAEFPVHTAWDLGYDDDTAIWFYQVITGEVRVLEYYYNSGKDIDHYAEVIGGKGYEYGVHWLPHDAKAKTLAAQGKSIQEQLANTLGWGHVRIVPRLSVEDGIQAVRQMFSRVWFDPACEEGVEALRQYHREWDDDRKMFRDRPHHDWTSHAADAFRYLAVAWREEPQKEQETGKPQDAYGFDNDDEETWKTA